MKEDMKKEVCVYMYV